MAKAPAPFECSYTPNFPELLMQLDISLAVSTYQAGKVVFLSALNENQLIQLPRNFNFAMALGVNGSRLAVATRDEVVILGNDPSLAANYPGQMNTYDNIYVPRATYHCGRLNIHGFHWDKTGLLAVNTQFSCLSYIDEDYSFKPIWKPPFITELAPEDRCHLNGMAIKNDKPEYVTSLGHTDTPTGWRGTRPFGGLLMHVDSSEIILEKLGMPHTPKFLNGELYALLSATGELIKIDPERGTYDVVVQLDGFVRGMCLVEDYLFVGLSRVRQNHPTEHLLPIAEKAKIAGIAAVHLPTGTVHARLNYRASVEEIFDVEALQGLKRPGILNTGNKHYRLSLNAPGLSWWGRPEEKED
ncbi:MAG: TIGR03032 family protein [Spirochaetales bacterium]|nr:TIGR03032 family protein [Spirochaetales bacterium]